MKKPEIQVILKSYQRKRSPDRASAIAFLKTIWSRISPKHARSQQAELTVVFLNDSQMLRYNSRYRNKNSSTDVLSFPLNEIIDGIHYLGDILISVETTESQSIQKGHSFRKELQILLLHGLLHLLGYDHETDQGQMNRLERRLRKEQNL